MRDSDFTKLLKRAAAIAVEHQQLSSRVTEAFQDRYGVSHSDTDDDELIDTLDYGRGAKRGFNAARVDEIMSSHGHPKIEDDEPA